MVTWLGVSVFVCSLFVRFLSLLVRFVLFGWLFVCARFVCLFICFPVTVGKSVPECMPKCWENHSKMTKFNGKTGKVDKNGGLEGTWGHFLGLRGTRSALKSWSPMSGRSPAFGGMPFWKLLGRKCPPKG